MAKVQWKKTLILWVYTFFKIPLIAWLRPRVLTLDEKTCQIMIKLSRRAKNHVNSMYFAALCTGADLAPGLMAMNVIHEKKAKCNFVFKDFSADFLKRATSNVYFTCDSGPEIEKTVLAAKKSGERENVTVNVVATTPDVTGNEPIATFTLTLSVKKRK